MNSKSDKFTVLNVTSILDDCTVTGCKNGGTCRTDRGPAACECPPGFAGKRCGKGAQVFYIYNYIHTFMYLIQFMNCKQVEFCSL